MDILNTQRFDAVKILFKQNNILLSPDDMAIYSNVFEIISQFVHNKLNTKEIFVIYDILSDVIQNKRPDIAAHVSKDDRIRVQVRLMEVLPETKGKLDLDEKLALAFCIYTGACVQVYSEERNKMCSGIVLFDSFDHIKNEFEYEKKNFPSRFDIKKRNVIFDGTYGYSVENPVNVTSIDAAYFYLNHLRYNAQPVKYERIGSFSNQYNEFIDGYNIFISKKLLFRDKTIKIATIYINSYCNDMPKVAPKGFTLV